MSARQGRILGLGGAGCLLLMVGAAPGDRPLLVFNTTASVPVGLYRLDEAPPTVGDLALVRPPPVLARWMADRRYLPANVPLIKRVAATGGSTVCGDHGVVRVDGLLVAKVRPSDRWGRPLHAFHGCRTLAADEIFLLNSAPDSLDGRYFGPLSRSAIVGRARPLWIGSR